MRADASGSESDSSSLLFCELPTSSLHKYQPASVAQHWTYSVQSENSEEVSESGQQDSWISPDGSIFDDRKA